MINDDLWGAVYLNWTGTGSQGDVFRNEADIAAGKNRN